MSTLKQQRNNLKDHSFRRSRCPIACVLDIIGDRWTLLIIRDLFMGRRRYKEFLEAGEGITSNILADRLDKLQQAGLVVRKPYQMNPVRYEYQLTKLGKSLDSVIFGMIDWGNKNLAGTIVRKRRSE